jgi:hypothetical protein
VAVGRVHARLLRDVLEVAGCYAREGQSLSVGPQIGLLLRCSGAKADRLLTEASVLAELPGGFGALEDGLLTVEQSAVTARELGRVPDEATRLVVWRRLLLRLAADAASGAVLPPPRLRELLRRWVLELAPTDAAEEREQAEAERRVEYRRREDGLTDIFLFGVGASLAQAVLSRVRDQSAPVSLFDDRTAAQRRLDAAVDLLLGRVGRTTCPQGSTDPVHATGARGGCAVRLSAGYRGAVRCSAAGARAARRSPRHDGQVAELSGYGPLEPQVLQQLLQAGPQLRAVFVDTAGVPVSVSDRVHRPARRNPQQVRTALLTLAAEPPPPPQPRHPGDHPPTAAAEPGGRVCDGQVRRHEARSDDGPELGAAHPPDSPGAYRPSRRLRRLLEARAPRCEFPGCGVRAVACDVEHDDAWPVGATCACQLGPCCRRHHRVKQEGWVKTRLPGSAVRWTSPTGRSWTSPAQHPPPAAPIRPLRPLPTGPSPWDELDPITMERELWWLDGCPDDPAGLELRAVDIDPDRTDQPDRQGDALTVGASRWTIDLDDPYSWTAPTLPDEPPNWT